jgi:phage baseplate assembly protein W
MRYQFSTYKNSDFKNNLDFHPSKQDLFLHKDEMAVKNCIKNLLFTGPYERRFRPALGSGLKKYLFDPVSASTADSIRTSIIRMIQNFEKRAELIDVIVQVTPDYNSYSATIVFRTINRIEPLTINTILERIR